VGSLIVAAGAWTAPLLADLDYRLPLEVTLEQVVYLEPPNPLAFHPSRFPIWIWMDVPSLYGFPVFGEPAVKIAWDRCEIVTDPNTRSFQPRGDVTNEVTRFAARHLPGAAGPVHLAKTCLYTLTPDRDFVLDVLPERPEIAVAIGGGHGFKFASLIGRILSELSIDGRSPRDLAPFRIDRPILKQKDPPRNYMV
jgi:sarcosine oxidase